MLTTSIEKYLRKNGYEQIMLKAVLIDMDGVLYDSMKNHVRAWYLTMTAIGVDCTEKEFYLYEGRTGASTIKLLFQRQFGREATETEVKRLYAEKVRHFHELPPIQPMPGANVLLAKIIAEGLRPVLVTGSGQRSLLESLNKDYPGVFTTEYMVTAFDVKYGKPHPEPYLIGMKKGHAKPWEAIVVENAPLGVEAGAASGAFTVAANTGPMPDEELWTSGSNVLYHSMQDLADHFGELSEAFKNTIVKS